jgi:hypothetical protein
MGNLIADHKKLTTWDGISFKLEELQEDGVGLVPIDLTGVTVVAKLKISKNRNPVFSFKTSDNTIQIPIPSNGTFFLTERFIDFPENTYLFTVKITYQDGRQEEIISDFWKIY